MPPRLRQVARTGVFAAGKRFPALIRAARSARTSAEARRFGRDVDGIEIDPQAVVFESYLGRSYSCSPRAIFEAMAADPAYAAWRCTWAVDAGYADALAAEGFAVRGLGDPNATPGRARDLAREVSPEALRSLREAELVVHGSRAYHEAYGRSAFWVTNSMLPAHLVPGPGQDYIQCWHGQPLKRLGCDVEAGGYALMPLAELHRRYRAEGERLTRLVTPSAFTSKKLATAFALGDKARDAIVEVGYPRNDLLRTFDAERASAARRRLGVPEGKKAVLYAPTWRDDQHDSRSGYTYRTEVDFAQLRESLGDEWVVLFRAHYFITNRFDFAALGGFVIDASGADDVNEVAIASDALVTDYSSLFFDYANLDRPIVFYMYDRMRYESEQRGFYLSLDELPGPVVTDEAALAAVLRSQGSDCADWAAARERFRAAFTYLDDGHAAERVLERVMPVRA